MTRMNDEYKKIIDSLSEKENNNSDNSAPSSNSNIVFYYNKEKENNKSEKEKNDHNEEHASENKDEQENKIEEKKENDNNTIKNDDITYDNNIHNHNENINSANENVNYFGYNFPVGNNMGSFYPNPMMGYPYPANVYPNPMMGYPYPVNGYPNPMMGYPYPVNGYPNPMMGYPSDMNSINSQNTNAQMHPNNFSFVPPKNEITNTNDNNAQFENSINELLNDDSLLVYDSNKDSNDQSISVNYDTSNKLISFKNVSKKYLADSISASTLALDDISFDINEGELVIFLGHSGAGKTTALNLLGGMDSVTSGSITVGDRDITNYSLDELTEYRKNDIGFIFQSYNLIQNLTVKENIDISTQIKNEKVDAAVILDKVGLKDKLNNYPAELSGGEQQRVAIARAIAKKPKILLCDEPTGALDFKTGNQILSLIQKTCFEERVTTIIITHNQQIVNMANKIICFNSGKITKVIVNKNPIDVRNIEW